MHAVMYNPVEPRLLASANAKEGVGLWDIRKPRRYIFMVLDFLLEKTPNIGVDLLS